MDSTAAIILAGGGARRLGGALKPAIRVGGVTMLDRVVAALRGAEPIVAVGPDTLPIPPGVRRVQEHPRGGGPVAGIAAAFDLAKVVEPAVVVIVGGDMPLLTPPDIGRLIHAIDGDTDGSVYIDATGRPQWLCGAWRTANLAVRLRELTIVRGSPAGGSLRELFGALRFREVPGGNEVLPPFFDCDTDDDIRRAEEWLAR